MTSQTSASGLNFEITWVCLAMRRRQSRDQPFTFFEHSSRLLWFRTVNLIEVDSCAVHRRHLQIKTNLCPVPKLCLLVRIPPNRLLLLREPLKTKGPGRRRPAGFRRWSARRADGRTPEAAGRSGGPTELRQRIQAGLWAGCKRAAGQAAVRPHGQRWAAGRPAGRPAKATRPSGSVLASQLNF